jgi:hypothetical protein
MILDIICIAFCVLAAFGTGFFAFRTPREEPPVPDLRKTLREMRRREFAEWDAEFARLSGPIVVVDEPVVGWEYRQISDTEIEICDWTGAVIRRIRS